MSGRLTESLLDELESRAKIQSTRSYKWIDVDSRDVLKLLREVRESRLVQLKFERKELQLLESKGE